MSDRLYAPQAQGAMQLSPLLRWQLMLQQAKQQVAARNALLLALRNRRPPPTVNALADVQNMGSLYSLYPGGGQGGQMMGMPQQGQPPTGGGGY